MTVYNLPLFSTCASHVRYDTDREVLTVTYRGSGKSYDYLEVPEWRYKQMLNTGSVGKFINNAIKPLYPVR